MGSQRYSNKQTKNFLDIFAGFKDGKPWVKTTEQSLGVRATLNEKPAIIKSRIRVLDYMNRRLRDFSETSLLSALILLLEWHPEAI